MQTTEKSEPSTGYLAPLKAQPRLLPILVTVVLVMSGMGVISPVLSLYAASFGVGTTLIGLTITAFGVARLIVNLPTGLLAERHGRKPLMLVGTVVLCVGSIGAAMAETFYGLVVWRFIQGIGSGCYMTVAMAAAADLSTPETRGRVMALYQTAILAGAGTGPVFGGVIATYFGFQAPFWAFAIVAGAASLYAWFGYRETLDTRPAALSGGGAGVGPSMGADLRALIAHRGFVAVTIITFGIFFTRTAAQWQLIPLIGNDDFGLTMAVIGMAMTLQAMANLAILPAAGLLVDRFGHERVIILSTLALALSLLLIALAPSAWLYLGAVVLVGFCIGVVNPASTAYAADRAPDGRFGPAMGVLRTMGDAGFVLGPILAGLAVDLLVWGYAAGMVLNALIILIGGVVFAYAATGTRAAPSGQAAAPQEHSAAPVEAVPHKSEL